MPLLVTEYGADARLHATAPRRFDKTEEYATRYHQAYLPAILARPFVVSGAVWNLVDCSSESRAAGATWAATPTGYPATACPTAQTATYWAPTSMRCMKRSAWDYRNFASLCPMGSMK